MIDSIKNWFSRLL